MSIPRGLTVLFLFLLLALTQTIAHSANLPCSGKKGGIARCQGDTFICNDGSVSASKRSCSQVMGGALGLMGGSASAPMAPAMGGDCSGRGGSYCIGPRGGRYCMTDSGKKSYLRQ